MLKSRRAPAGTVVEESRVARWSARGAAIVGSIPVGICWLLGVAFLIDMIRQHDAAQTVSGVVLVVAETAIVVVWVRWARRSVTVLTTAAVSFPARRGQPGRIPLEEIQAVAVVHTAKGWAMWVWPDGAPAVRLPVPLRVFTLKAQSRARPTGDYWLRVAESPCGRAASAIYAQARTAQGERGPLQAAPPVAELRPRGPASLSYRDVRYWSPTNEREPTA